jgi:hypothetical protein
LVSRRHGVLAGSLGTDEDFVGYTTSDTHDKTAPNSPGSGQIIPSGPYIGTTSVNKFWIMIEAASADRHRPSTSCIGATLLLAGKRSVPVEPPLSQESKLSNYPNKSAEEGGHGPARRGIDDHFFVLDRCCIFLGSVPVTLPMAVIVRRKVTCRKNRSQKKLFGQQKSRPGLRPFSAGLR